jgi:hypothetical protein
MRVSPNSPPSLESALEAKQAQHLNPTERKPIHLDGLRAACPHCGHATAFRQLGNPVPSAKTLSDLDDCVDFQIIQIICPGCDRISIVALGYLANKAMPWPTPRLRLLWPKPIRPSKAPETLDDRIRQYYDESREILRDSPAAAALLARSCLQDVLRNKLSIKNGS